MNHLLLGVDCWQRLSLYGRGGVLCRDALDTMCMLAVPPRARGALPMESRAVNTRSPIRSRAQKLPASCAGGVVSSLGLLGQTGKEEELSVPLMIVHWRI